MEKDGPQTEEEKEHLLDKGFRISGLFQKVKRNLSDDASDIRSDESRTILHIYDSSESESNQDNVVQTVSDINQGFDSGDDAAESGKNGQNSDTLGDLLHYDAVVPTVEESTDPSPFETVGTEDVDGDSVLSRVASIDMVEEEQFYGANDDDNSQVSLEMIDQPGVDETNGEWSEPRVSRAADEMNLGADEPIGTGEVTHSGAEDDSREGEFTGVEIEAEVVSPTVETTIEGVRQDYDENLFTPDEDKNEPTNVLTKDDLSGVKSRKELLKKFESKKIVTKRINKILGSKPETRNYTEDLRSLQIELLKFQRWVEANDERIIVIFEGLDRIENRFMIDRFAEHLSVDTYRIERFSKPSKEEKKDWYFQRYADRLPKKGEIVFIDGGWYDRAIVEPVNGKCTGEEYGQFLKHLPEFESMVVESGVRIVKFWFSISKKEQRKRYKNRKKDKALRGSLTKFDKTAQKYWGEYKHYRELMFRTTHSPLTPWIVVKANVKKTARLESIKYLLSLFEYEGKENAAISLNPDPKLIHRAIEEQFSPDSEKS